MAAANANAVHEKGVIHPWVSKVLISKEQIEQQLDAIAAKINTEYANCSQLVVVGILKGAFIFTADLVRRLTVPVNVEFMAVSSYGDATSSSGTVRILMDLRRDIKDKDVLIVEDIIDTGLTAKNLLEMLRLREPRSLAICSFLRKSQNCVVDIPVKFVAFEISKDAFVVGYGLDWAEKLRELEYVGILKEELYKKQ
jgi:hypoxanthine phosphoribosyltransferase